MLFRSCSFSCPPVLDRSRVLQSMSPSPGRVRGPKSFRLSCVSAVASREALEDRPGSVLTFTAAQPEVAGRESKVVRERRVMLSRVSFERLLGEGWREEIGVLRVSLSSARSLERL